ncbi:MAG: AAA family ATPase [Actinobacteria bacterium]|nr:AAA family ATPase [Actinomycetota bacterium]
MLDLTADLGLINDLTLPSVEIGSDAEVVTQPRHEHLPQPSPDLADLLFVGHDWLLEVRAVLDERHQIVFYGPPGTGKTFIARKLAADLVGPEQVKLVQFHPAYTYEDFFEGYRPVPGRDDGTIAFELKPGPFRKLVDRAREHPEQAFILIIDEINRANLAKVFGELYFLLEYRDQAVDLLYSSDDEGFTLPTNFYLIGTMNTADRSIALVDAAMRRRFAFVSLQPDEEPTRSLLARWSAHQGLGNIAASLLSELNRRIDDPDFRIGPAYFMKSEASDAHSRERLDRTWRTSILPLLQEHHYGQWESVRRRYELDSLLKTIDEE